MSKNGSRCDLCPRGKELKEYKCQTCEEGKYTNKVAGMCESCADKRGEVINDQTECAICPAGKELRNHKCKQCEAQKYSSTEGNACVLCPGFVGRNHSTCHSCPADAETQKDGYSCHCLPQYFQIWQSDVSKIEGVDLQKAVNKLETFEKALNKSFGGDEIEPFACLECPTGSSCSQAGTTLDTIQPKNSFTFGFQNGRLIKNIYWECEVAENCKVQDGVHACHEGYQMVRQYFYF